MAFLLKKIAAPLILASFLMTAFFGFVAMSYGPDGRMQGDCPFSAAGRAACPQDAVAVALHHLSSYQSFLSAPIVPTITSLIIAWLVIVSGAFAFLFHPPFHRPLVPVLYHSTPFTSHDRKIKRWLSLFEYSPSR